MPFLDNHCRSSSQQKAHAPKADVAQDLDRMSPDMYIIFSDLRGEPKQQRRGFVRSGQGARRQCMKTLFIAVKVNVLAKPKRIISKPGASSGEPRCITEKNAFPLIRVVIFCGNLPHTSFNVL
jgi:hypothetical protein